MRGAARIGLGAVAAVLARTWTLEIRGEESVVQLRRQGRAIVFAVWHESLLAPLWHRRGQGITLLVSGHTDGRYLAAAALRWGYRVASGSSTRGAVGGLKSVVRALRAGAAVAVTPDGPRGPARMAKAGAITAAQASGAAIVPVASCPTAAWRARSWDRMVIPRPFSRVRVVYGEALVGIPAGREAREAARCRLERALEAAAQDARS